MRGPAPAAGKVPSMFDILHETPLDVAAREALLDACFGEARFAKTCERLRAGRLPADGLALKATPQRRAGRDDPALERPGGTRPSGTAARPCCGRSGAAGRRHRRQAHPRIARSLVGARAPRGPACRGCALLRPFRIRADLRRRIAASRSARAGALPRPRARAGRARGFGRARHRDRDPDGRAVGAGFWTDGANLNPVSRAA